MSSHKTCYVIKTYQDLLAVQMALMQPLEDTYSSNLSSSLIFCAYTDVDAYLVS